MPPDCRCRAAIRTGTRSTAPQPTAITLKIIADDGQSQANAQAETAILRLAPMQGQRYWVERAFEDAKGKCGLADYQAVGWRSWHHHVTMVMLAMLFIAEQRVAHHLGFELLTPRDIVEMLKETLPHKPEGRDALVARINQRHERRRGAIASGFRTQRKQAAS